MVAEIIEIKDPAQFPEILAKVSQEQEYVIAIFTGVIDPQTEQNWCPDCEVAKPNIKKYILDKAYGKILYCIVDRPAWKGTPLHPYKKSALLKCKGVPTILGILNGDQVVIRAENDDDFQNPELLSAIVNQ